MKKFKTTGLVMAGSAAMILAGCSDDAANEGANGETNIGEAVEYTITGIEPGAGITGQATNMLEDYENLAGWELETSSTAGMMTELEQAIQNEEPIIVTGWTPHWMFERYDLKMLEDPELSFGEGDDIHTITREGLEQDMPEANAVLDAFNWSVEEMQVVIEEGQDIDMEEAAANWVEENQDQVDSWLEGVEPVDDVSIDIISVPWDSERASANVISLALEQIGYDVTITDVDPSILFQAVGNGEADASVAPWLPNTHGAFMDEYGESIVDLGPNAEGTMNALVVPEYMDVESIEDLPAAE